MHVQSQVEVSSVRSRQVAALGDRYHRPVGGALRPEAPVPGLEVEVEPLLDRRAELISKGLQALQLTCLGGSVNKGFAYGTPGPTAVWTREGPPPLPTNP